MSWTTTDTQSLLRAVQNAAASCDRHGDPDRLHDIAKSAVKAAVDLHLQQLCQLAKVIKRSWEGLPRQQKQSDPTPLDLICSLGLLLSRLYACAAACASGGPLQQEAQQLLQQICSTAAQHLLQESIAGHLFIFRWHEQQQQEDTATANSKDASSPSSSILDSIIQSGYSKYGPPSEPLMADPDPNPQSLEPSAIPRFVASKYVPHTHSKWTGSFLLPVLPTAAAWQSAQEVLLCWSNIGCSIEEQGLPMEVNAGMQLLVQLCVVSGMVAFVVLRDCICIAVTRDWCMAWCLLLLM